MIVENHEIQEDVGKETEIKITGRSFESFFENRFVGANRMWPTAASATEEYVVAAATTWDQVLALILDHTDPEKVFDKNDALYYVTVLSDVTGTGEMVARPIKRGSVYSRMIELMDIDNLGIKTVRPGIKSPLGFSSPNMAVVIHKGADLSGEISLSYAS